MNKDKYVARVSDLELQKALDTVGAVLIEGAKWCGKTSSAANFAKSAIYMQDPDNAASYRLMADTKPSLLLQGANLRLLDEWQMLPVLWDAVKFEVDKRGETGQFILTGSATPSDNVVAHTGTGRFARILMRPMSLYESKESTGTVSLSDLFNGKHDIESVSALSIEQLAFALCRGGFPATIGKRGATALRMSIDYVESVINQDISKVDGVEKNPAKVRLLLRSLARNIATQASLQTVLADLRQRKQVYPKNFSFLL